MAQDNAGTVRAIEEAWDRGKLDELDQHFAADFDNSRSGTPGLPGGLEGAKMAHQGVMQSFPDRNVEIVDVISEADQVSSGSGSPARTEGVSPRSRFRPTAGPSTSRPGASIGSRTARWSSIKG